MIDQNKVYYLCPCEGILVFPKDLPEDYYSPGIFSVLGDLKDNYLIKVDGDKRYGYYTMQKQGYQYIVKLGKHNVHYLIEDAEQTFEGQKVTYLIPASPQEHNKLEEACINGLLLIGDNGL